MSWQPCQHAKLPAWLVGWLSHLDNLAIWLAWISWRLGHNGHLTTWLLEQLGHLGSLVTWTSLVSLDFEPYKDEGVSNLSASWVGVCEVGRFFDSYVCRQLSLSKGLGPRSWRTGQLCPDLQNQITGLLHPINESALGDSASSQVFIERLLGMGCDNAPYCAHMMSNILCNILSNSC